MIGLGSDKKTTNQNNLPYLNLHFCRWLRLLLLLVVVLTRWSGCMSHNITSLSTLVVHFSSCTISQACIIGGKIRASCILCNTKNNQEENMTQPDGKSTTVLEFLWYKNHLWHWWLNILWDDLADSGEFFYCRARDEWIPLQSLYGR